VELLEPIAALEPEIQTHKDFTFILMAGERRTYNANQIFRDPAWRKVDHEGALRMHPDDAHALSLANGDQAHYTTERERLLVTMRLNDSLRPGVVTFPHGYGVCFQNSPPMAPPVNQLTSASHCEPFSKTPYHKYVPACWPCP
jgi:anaerobic selenocysteine-containing dehydrogenase